MPTAAIATFGAGRLDPYRNPELAKIRNVNLKASTTYAAGTVLGEITASPGTYGPYASGNSDGTQNPTGVLQYAGITDASGNFTRGTSITAGASEWGQTDKYGQMFYQGEFRTEDLTGLDANAVTKLGRIIQGNTTAGSLLITGA